MRRLISGILMALILAFLLTGCKASDETASSGVTTIEINKDGTVTHTIIEDFSASYYDLEELTESVQEELDTYNASAGEERITLGDVELENGVLTMVMNFASTSDYTGLYRLALFSGTVKEAFSAGYELNITLYDASGDGSTIVKEDILEMGDKHMLVIREAVQVKVYGEILYVSEDVETSSGSRMATVTDGENISYIIFK